MKNAKFCGFVISAIAAVWGVACSEQFEVGADTETAVSTLTRSDVGVPEFMPLHVVPDSAKAKMTEKEYELWMTMSSVYKVDYSFMNMELDSGQKELLYATIENICHDIESGAETEYAGCFTVWKLVDSLDISKIERLTAGEGPIQGWQAVGPSTVHSVAGRDARVMVTATCEVKGNSVTAAGNATAYASGADAVTFNGSAAVSVSGPRTIRISCAGTLKYYTYDPFAPSGHGSVKESQFNDSVNIFVL